MPLELRRAWMEPAGGGALRLDEAARGLVTFRPLNLIGAWPMSGPFDAVFCRNVVIYFDEKTQMRLLNRMTAAASAPAAISISAIPSASIGPAEALFKADGTTAYRKLGGERPMSRIKVLVVDDSSDHAPAGGARARGRSGHRGGGRRESALEARDLIKQLNPDVMTLDVEMPEMDGLSFLERVMRLQAHAGGHGLDADRAGHRDGDRGAGARRGRLRGEAHAPPTRGASTNFPPR